jgi:hypothetical protein
MILNNTIILPGDNPELSKKLLSSLIQKSDVLAIIIFGKDDASEAAVKKADVRAGAIVAGISRKVVWMQDTSIITYLKTIITAGEGGDPESINPNTHIGISISMTDILTWKIQRTPVPDYIKMEQAFIKAGKI